jgi:putative heme-binding domain-containing protein
MTALVLLLVGFLAIAGICDGAQLEPSSSGGSSLESRLLEEQPATLARAAREQGDPARGAVLFYQPALACIKCHGQTGGKQSIGPDLSRPGDKLMGTDLVDAILRPSRVIKKGYESVTIITRTGRTITGLIAEENGGRLVVRDAAQDFKPVTIDRADIEERATLKVSLMPAGLVNQLATRQQFLDLVCYLLEVSEKGPARERELRPDPALLAAPPLPEYENHIDHAGFLAGLDAKSFQRGEAIYNRLCINCHGTRDKVGSLPASLRFASGKFKNGCDPYSMYQTLTRGFGMMTPQTWMVPQQKYDVIHYIRETYLRPFNPSQYVPIDAAYLSRLPGGNTRGPAPSILEPWSMMNYGPTLMTTIEVGHDGTNFAYKGIAVRLDPGPGGIARGHAWMLYDHDTLRLAAAWTGEGFIDWNSVQFTGQHEVHPHVAGQVHAANPTGPGWANLAGQTFTDTRLRGRDGRPYGPLPRSWAHYCGLYHYGNQAILSYTVGETQVLETPGMVHSGSVPVFTRTFNIGPRACQMVLQVAHRSGASVALAPLGSGKKTGTQIVVVGPIPSESISAKAEPLLVAGISGSFPENQWQLAPDNNLRLHVPPGEKPLRFTLWFAQVDKPGDAQRLAGSLAIPQPELDLTAMTHGGPARWPARLTTGAQIGKDDGPFAVDSLTQPDDNPWYCRLRFGGFDFLPFPPSPGVREARVGWFPPSPPLRGRGVGGEGEHNRAAICTWDGDVWLVDGIAHPEHGLTWQRIASGLFQPLGLKVVDGQIYVCCRDQIVVLRDLNGDGETDFYENFNNDHQVTDHFHEFAMGLQTDGAGNFYYCKGGRHALPALVPHHGTLLRVSKDGSRTDIVATGFRAANGVCVNPDGTFFLTDQEGHWTPKNRINWVVEGGFYGYMWGYHSITDPSDAAMKQPVCWITNDFDRSPAEMLWVDSKAWGPLQGSLLNLSYGTGKVFIVPHEKVNGRMQGGMCRLPMPLFPTGVMRGRFHPDNGQLYACGLFVWAGNQEQPGGFYRVRYTGKPLWVPLVLRAHRKEMQITFSDPVDPKSAADPHNYAVKLWHLKRSAEYGSRHYDEHPLRVSGGRLSPDGKTLAIEIPELTPTQCMEIRYFLKGSGGEPVEGVIHNTIQELPD